RRVLQRLGGGDQLFAPPGLGAARAVEARIERPEDLVEALPECALDLRAREGQRTHAPAEIAPPGLDFLERRRRGFRRREPGLDLVAERGARLRRGFLFRRALGAKFQHRPEGARQNGVEALPLRLARGAGQVALLPVVAQRADRRGERLDVRLFWLGQQRFGGLDQLLATLVVAPLRPVPHLRELREMALELALQPCGQRRRGGAAVDLLLDLERLGQVPRGEVLLELVEQPANFVPVTVPERPGRFARGLLLFALRCRGRRGRDLVQLLPRALQGDGERGGRRVPGKPRWALAGEAGELLAEARNVALRAGAFDFSAQRFGERGGGAELAQRLHVGVHALVRGGGEVDDFLRHFALGAQLGERFLELAQLPGGKGARFRRRLDQAAEARGELRRQRRARQVAPAHTQDVVAVPVDAVIAMLARFRDA